MKNYTIDNLHSEIGFKIKHLMISTVNGSFTKFNAEMSSPNDDNFEDSVITFEADVDSVNTNITDRDNHLKSADFFDAETHPKLTFESTSVKQEGSKYEICGNLTIKGISAPIRLIGTYNGNDVDAYGQTKHGFDIEGSISRGDYGLSFNITGGKGSLIIGDEVKLNITIQMTEK